MKILRYEAHNVMRVEDIQFDLDGHHLFLVGGDNEQGKSSALKGLLMLLCGKQNMDFPDVALREGEREGWAKVELKPDEQDAFKELYDGLVVEIKFKRGRNGNVTEAFKFTDTDGNKISNPRTILTSLFHARGLDVLGWLKLPRKDKRNLLLSAVGVDPDQFEAQRKKLFDERTEVNRDLKNAQSRLEKMPKYDDVPDESVSIANLMEDLTRAQAANQANNRDRQHLEKLKGECQDAIDNVHNLREELNKLETRLAKAEVHKSNCRRRCDKLEKVVAGLRDKDESTIRQQIETAEDTNSKITANRIHRETINEVQTLRGQAESLTCDMEAIEERKQGLLESAKWPMPGLSVDDEGVLLNGLPIEQASQSRKIRASTNIAMALNPTLRLFVCEDGGDLGLGALRELESILKEKGYQMIVEMVTRTKEDESRCAVVIENGRVRE